MSATRVAFGTLLLWAGLTAVALARDMAVVLNKSNNAGTLTLAELTKICKGQVSRWPDGRPVTFFTRDPALPEMKILLEKVYATSGSEVQALITAANHGRANHPAIIVVDSDQAVVKKVESTPGAVGMVDVYSISGGVKVSKVGGKLPLEPGYILHGN